MTEKEMMIDVGAAAESVGTSSDAPLYAIESLCMRCRENGTTRFLLTKIPHFREVVLMAFECPHCSERNNEIQFAGKLAPQGCTYTLNVPTGDKTVLNRQVVKSDSGTIKIPELEFEVPPDAQRGTLSTVEGVLMRAAEELAALQEERRRVDPKMAEALDAFLVKLKECSTGNQAFTFIIDDPSGNSFIENPYAPSRDPLLSTHYYDRTSEQQEQLGFLSEKNGDEASAAQTEGPVIVGTTNGNEHSTEEKQRYTPAGTTKLPHGSVGAERAHRAIAEGSSAEIAATLFKYSAPEEVMTFPATCGACISPCETRMYVTNIPYFKEVIVMASTCESCGYRNSELKPGGSIPKKGKKITLQVKSKRDLSRDVIKSDSAMVIVPEVELELSPGTLGGLVTTVEGLICQISESLKRVHGFSIGDSADPWRKNKWQDFDNHLKKLLECEEEWSLVLDDALANSFIAPATDDFEADTQLISEDYERSWDQDEELGLHDMDTTVADVAYEKGDQASAST
ncbi:zinc finger protein [Marchantia polymorpha subsp. ruderalis]|uniref:Zinc finger ZPR1-type domain-containing protein n=2 Tax=Marchantia polymorpha TaxID=3197 RepID=A0AAF6AZ30_MARPO|nr:hypothetical protein MARPO_0085s0072 [Marchantia polymorpha]BBN05014.1 hypothetical protein Mp_3g09550 [Marchantia polymorpha subsp. ruderalis]|eukprot:PTQ33862.1 hypothetical protein MARPO_0085s0072 [Marchantia polymorpha]